MAMVQRILVGLLALGSAFMALSAWFNPAVIAKNFQLAPAGPVGDAAIKADVGGLFWAIAIFAGLAAWKRSPMWLLGAIIPSATALSGRIVNAAMNGVQPGTVPPMIVEIVALIVFFWARGAWKKTPEGL